VLPALPKATSTSPNEVTIIGDNGVPRHYIKELQPDGSYVYIEEGVTPHASISAPRTGDPIELWGFLFLLSGGAAVLFSRKRKPEDAL
jgi:hypothetical protein